MKRFFLFLLATLLAAALILPAGAEPIDDVNEFMKLSGFEIATDPPDFAPEGGLFEGGASVCMLMENEMEIGEQKIPFSIILWSDGEHVYTAGASLTESARTPEDARRAFIDLLGLRAWDAAGWAFADGSGASYVAPGFDAEGLEITADTYRDADAFVAAAREALDGPVTPSADAETSLGADFAAMTDEELSAMIAAAQAELDGRKDTGEPAPDGALVIREGEELTLLDEQGLMLKLTGKISEWGEENLYVDLEYIFENNTEEEYSISFNDAYVNGWDILIFGVGDVAPGKKKRGDITIMFERSGIKDLSEVKTIETTLQTYKGPFPGDLQKDLVLTFG